MICTATTRLTAEQCLERLAECPALPRGERILTANDVLGFASHRSKNLWGRLIAHHPAIGSCWVHGDERLKALAAPVRRLREERRALREALADVIGPPCEKRTRWCFTHQTNDCRADEARKLLVTP